MFPALSARKKSRIAAFLLFAVATALPADAPPTNQPADILTFLNKTVVWYRLLTSQQELVREPNDAVFLNQNRLIADQVVRLAFEFARTEAQQISTQDKTKGTEQQAPPNASQYQNLVNLKEKSSQRIEQVQHELDSLKQQLATAQGKQLKTLQSEVAETEDELELLKARNDTLQSMLQFASGVNSFGGSKGLQAQIEELARTAP